MTQTLSPATSLSGTVQLPGDKSISHRYAMLAAIAEGTSVIEHFAASRDCHSTLECLQVARSRSAGTRPNRNDPRARPARAESARARMLDAGNSGTTIRLLSGILAGHPFESSITGDESLSNRPMGRIIRPLRLMGAAIESRERELPPLRIRGGSLKGIRYSLPVASAQVKSCVLFAGLYGDAPTAVEETIPTRDHTRNRTEGIRRHSADSGELDRSGSGTQIAGATSGRPGRPVGSGVLSGRGSPGSELRAFASGSWIEWQAPRVARLPCARRSGSEG